MNINFLAVILGIAGSMGSKLWTPTGRIKTEPRPELQNLKPPRMPKLEPHPRYARAPIKSDSVPDKSTVKSKRIAKAKRKAKRGY